MKRKIAILPLLIIFACQNSLDTYQVYSPSGVNQIEFALSSDGRPFYMVKHKGSTVIDTSFISFSFKDQPALNTHLEITNTTTSSFEETWEMPWGEQREVKNHYHDLKVELRETIKPFRQINIEFRNYDDGIGFRYEFLAQSSQDSLTILEENTSFNLNADHTTWWIPADWDSYEHLYNETKLSEINAFDHIKAPGLGHTSIFDNAVHTPVTMRSKEGIHLSIHEAALIDYSSMTLKVDTAKLKMTSQLVGSDRSGFKVKRALPFKTPWRTIQIADKAKDLLSSNLIVNLNEPNQLGDMSWFEPKKYMGIWWEMHLEKGRWDYGMTMNNSTQKWEDTGQAHNKHSATTENAKKYIDFASKNNIGGLLVEGWNTGWEKWVGFEDREGVFDFVTAYPDYDLAEVVKYGKQRGVEIIMHHETSAAPRTYEHQLDSAYSLMKALGIHSVKSGYVGRIIPKGEYHHGQWMVNHYQKALEKAAQFQIAINAHEPIKDTGLRRTFPNAISREGLRGQEFNAWSPDGGNPPNHISNVMFTRMLAGPIDFTPGVFDLSLATKENNSVNTTLAKQLALYVVIYSPIQMACDLPENYENQQAFQFIRDVGVNWEYTKVIDGEVGEFVVIARQERETNNWFVGGITGEKERDFILDFGFLEESTSYLATIYRDTKDSHYLTNPRSIMIEEIQVTRDSQLNITMQESGGFAISLVKN